MMAIGHIPSLATTEQKVFALELFLEKYHHIDLQDIYKWLYYGEFGPSQLIKVSKIPELQHLLNDIQYEASHDILSDTLWEPVGLSLKFIKVFLSPYFKQDCPLKRLISLMNRSIAFRGTRMHFKLDWSFIKEYFIRNKLYTKQDFYNFEDRNSYQILPDLPYTDEFLINFPYRYRVVPRKLFFEFFPEYDDKRNVKPQRSGDSLLD
ncbi:MAG: hypothetical protein H7A23_13520 [Leptospiraceae bacterium]|nr:hypothetical protein [Leptospiraceae bacterium]